MQFDDWLDDKPQAVATYAASGLNHSRSPRLLRLASCAACRLLPHLDKLYGQYDQTFARRFLSLAESFADGLLGRGARREDRRLALEWVAGLSRLFTAMGFIEYARCIAETLVDDEELGPVLQKTAGLMTFGGVTAPERMKRNRALCNAVRDIFGDGVQGERGWELRRPALAWKWYGPMPPPTAWREPALSQWRNNGLIRPRWAPDPEAWRTAQDIHHDILEAQVTSGILPTRQVQVLGDCLEECGCDDTALLEHLHGPGPHFRGCWAIDLIQGKS